MPKLRTLLCIALTLAVIVPLLAADKPKATTKARPVAARVEKVSPGDWAQWGGGPQRNNTPEVANLPAEWNVGGFDPKTGEWKKDKAKNIKWVARLGSQ